MTPWNQMLPSTTPRPFTPPRSGTLYTQPEMIHQLPTRMRSGNGDTIRVRLPRRMKFPLRSTTVPVVCALVLFLARIASPQISYTSQIKPILDQNCKLCHSAEEHVSGFDSTTVASLQRPGLKAGPGVVPGKPDESAIIQYVEGKRQPRMPNGLPPLSPEQIRILRDWIAAGAPSDSAPASQTKIAPTNPTSSEDIAKEEALRSQFAADPEQFLIARRNLRLKQLPVAPPV